MHHIVTKQTHDLINRLRDHAEPATIGPFPFRCNATEGLDKLVEAVNDVVAAMPAEDLAIVTEAVEFVGLPDELLEYGNATMGFCVQLTKPPEKCTVVLFDSSVVMEMSPSAMRHLVAHELRHVWQIAVEYKHSAKWQRALSAIATRQILEDDANDYAASLGFLADSVLMAKVFDYPEDESFKAVLRNWKQLNTDQKMQIAEFLALYGAEWRNFATAIANDARLFTVAAMWQSLPEANRDYIEQHVKSAAVLEPVLADAELC